MPRDTTPTYDSDLARATGLLLACELTMGLGDQGHLSIATLPDPRLILSLPQPIRTSLKRRLDDAQRAAQEMLRRHHPLLDHLARDLEQRGFIGETELAQRLEGLRCRPADSASPTSDAPLRSAGERSTAPEHRPANSAVACNDQAGLE